MKRILLLLVLAGLTAARGANPAPAKPVLTLYAPATIPSAGPGALTAIPKPSSGDYIGFLQRNSDNDDGRQTPPGGAAPQDNDDSQAGPDDNDLVQVKLAFTGLKESLNSGQIVLTLPAHVRAFADKNTPITASSGGATSTITVDLASPGTDPGQKLLEKMAKSPEFETYLYVEALDDYKSGTITVEYIPNGKTSGPKDAGGLLTVEMMVDANRDGEMSFTEPTVHDKDGTTPQKPYRFWLNNDQDEKLDDETVPATTEDHTRPKIRNIRDLEDWTRLWISFKGLAELIKTSDVSVELQFEAIPGSPTPTIKICKAVEAEGGMKYIDEESEANAQITGETNAVYGPITGSAAVNLKAVPHAHWTKNLTEDYPYLHLLFEGAVEGKGKLQLKIKKGGTLIGTYPDLFLDIQDIKKMYVRVKARPNDMDDPKDNPGYPKPYESISNQPTYPEVSIVPDPIEPRYAFEKPQDETKQAVVYLHGWNVKYWKGQNAAQTMFKRLWWRGYKGRFCIFRWPTLTINDEEAGFDFNYNTGEHRAWGFGPALKNYVDGLHLELRDYSINIAAHSQGNVVAGEALKLGMQIDNYVLMQAAVPASAYDETVPQVLTFQTAETNQPTPQLLTDGGYAGYLANVSGRLANYFNTQDGTLAKWSIDNRDMKPVIKAFAFNAQDTFVYSFQGAVSPPASKSKLTWIHTYVDEAGIGHTNIIGQRDVIAAHERMAFIARSLTYTVGQRSDTGGPIRKNKAFSLTGLGFDRNHSAQWEWPCQWVDGFYLRLMDDINPE